MGNFGSLLSWFYAVLRGSIASWSRFLLSAAASGFRSNSVTKLASNCCGATNRVEVFASSAPGVTFRARGAPGPPGG
jgi:hypothetical protein